MTPLRVEFQMAGAMIAPTHPVHLDALLAYASVQEAIANRRDQPHSYQDALPLAAERQEDLEVWKASALHFEATSEVFLQQRFRRTDSNAIAHEVELGFLRTKATTVNQGAGPYRNHVLFDALREVRTATAWCVGDKGRVEELLRHVRSIGKLARNSRGRVACKRNLRGAETLKIRVVEDPAAEEKWRLRIFPWQPDASHLPLIAGYRPPYWHIENRAICYARPEIFG